MNLFFKLIAGSSLSASLLLPIHAQELPKRPIERTTAEAAKLKKEFVENLRKVVLEKCNETADIADRAQRFKSCKCYVDSYVDRYTPESLYAMNIWSRNNPGKNSIMRIMLEPERIKCNIPG